MLLFVWIQKKAEKILPCCCSLNVLHCDWLDRHFNLLCGGSRGKPQSVRECDAIFLLRHFPRGFFHVRIPGIRRVLWSQIKAFVILRTGNIFNLLLYFHIWIFRFSNSKTTGTGGESIWRLAVAVLVSILHRSWSGRHQFLPPWYVLLQATEQDFWHRAEAHHAPILRHDFPHRGYCVRYSSLVSWRYQPRLYSPNLHDFG